MDLWSRVILADKAGGGPMRRLIYRPVSPYGMGALFLAVIGIILCPLLTGDVFAQNSDEHPLFCEPIDLSQMQPEDSHAAGKRAYSLNTGDPRTVRVIYFVPNDRSFSITVEDSIKRAARQVRELFLRPDESARIWSQCHQH